MNLFITILLLTHVIGSCMPSHPYGTRYALGFCHVEIRSENRLNQVCNHAWFRLVKKKSESGTITYLIQPVFRSDFYVMETQARIESVYRLVSSYCQKILYHVCIQSRIRQEKNQISIGPEYYWLCKKYTANLLRQNRICKIVSDTQCKGTDADISFCITSVSDLIQSWKRPVDTPAQAAASNPAWPTQITFVSIHSTPYYICKNSG